VYKSLAPVGWVLQQVKTSSNMKIEELYQLHLPHDKKTSRLKAASFDQLHNRIALGFRKEIIGMT
jgi:hypothetical protein